ncbi:MFS transporter [Streptomyces thermolineatus]|uniref:MFS transporter n=1 Tax=Streptomyces thermolineatus TaxID=44033 RepID=UPI00384DD977
MSALPRPNRGTARPTAAVPRAGLVQYALGSAGMGIYVTVPGLLLLYFLTDTLGVPPWLAGLALLVPKVVDVVLHPFVGSVSDRDRARNGNRVRVLAAGCLLAVAFTATFAVPGSAAADPYLAAGWVAVWFVVGNTLFAAYQVPYLATPTDVDVGYDERTRIMSFRMVVLTLGILVGGALAPLLVGDGSGVSGYVVMALCLGAFMLIFQAVGVGGVRSLARAGTAPGGAAEGRAAEDGAAAGAVPPARAALAQAWSVLRANRSFRVLAGSYLLVSTTTHLVLAGLPYFAEYALGRPGLTTVLVGSFVAPALVATPVWFRISRTLGKQRCLLAAQWAFVLGSLGMLAGARTGLAVVVLATLVLGVSFAGLQLFPFSMVPDTVRAAGTGEVDRAGAYTGVWTATEAVGSAAGPYLYSAALAAGGFAATRAGEQVAQTAGAHTAVLLGFTVLPAALMVLSVLAQRRYLLDSDARGRPEHPATDPGAAPGTPREA